jgi:hypothetical protein
MIMPFTTYITPKRVTGLAASGVEALQIAFERRKAKGEDVVILSHSLGRPQVSISHGLLLEQTSEGQIKYDASTLVGSSGAPIFDSTIKLVIGMHMGGVQKPPEAPINFGVVIGAQLTSGQLSRLAKP